MFYAEHYFSNQSPLFLIPDICSYSLERFVALLSTMSSVVLVRFDPSTQLRFCNWRNELVITEKWIADPDIANLRKQEK